MHCAGPGPFHFEINILKENKQHGTRKSLLSLLAATHLIKDKQHQTVEDQYEAAKATTEHIADMIEAGWDVAIGHGNGPQVGFILRRSEIAAQGRRDARSPAGCVRG
jgi:carbamate kinase